MKILVIQITRPGDIFCTWPALSSLRRKYPSAEIHFLVRRKFYQAAQDFYVVDHFWQLDTEKIMSPLIYDPQNVNGSILELSKIINDLRQQDFDQIINLSFSPASSFITHLVAVDKTKVMGYSRTSDFYLFIPDESARYFNAQAGVSKSNRLHVVDMFSMVAQTELQDADMQLYKFHGTKEGIVCHLGASQTHKTWPVHRWSELISMLVEKNKTITLIGGKDDIEKANQVIEQVQSDKLINLVGKTTFKELAKVLAGADYFIGCDSGPLHVANSVGCKSINLSVGMVNFWETGPTVSGSQVLVARNPENLSAREVFLSIFEKNKKSYICDGKMMVRFDDQGNSTEGGWATVLWIHFGGPTPYFSHLDIQFLQQIEEVCNLAKGEITKIINNKQCTFDLLSRAEEILTIISKTNFILAPLIYYFFTEKANIPPGTQAQVAEQTLQCFEWLGAMAKKGIFPDDAKLLENG